MVWKDLEAMCNRSLSFCLSKKKFWFVFPVLMGCGLLIVLCRAMAEGSGDWVRMSLAFLPVFLSAGVLLAMGLVLVRLYHDEVKGLRLSLSRTLKHSWELMIGAAYVSVPFIVAYLFLWTLLGVFYLLKGVAGLGVVLFFGPFLLLFGLMVLALINLLLVFFVTPLVALKSEMKFSLGEELFKRIKKNPFAHMVLFGIGILPLLIVGGLLSLAAIVTEVTYLQPEKTLAVTLEWFFIMVPFVALFTPLIVFFFNFSAEAYVWIKKRSP